MNEEPKTSQQTQDNPEEQAREQDRLQDQLRERTEKIWDATRKTLSHAGFKAGQYKRIVQKKIDLAAVHKKIGAAHAELGKLVDEAHEGGASAILEREEIRDMLTRLDEYKQKAAALEHEIEMIKAEEPPPETEAG